MTTNVVNLKEMLVMLQQLNKKNYKAPVVHKEYHKPSLSLLKKYPGAQETKIDPAEFPTYIGLELEEKLSEFGFESAVENIRKGPVITRYEMRLAKGVKISQIKNVSEDIALALMSGNIRIQAPIPGTNLIGIEVGNEKQSVIGFKDILKKVSKERLPIAIGTDIVGEPKVFDLVTMPHLLIAGQTGSGKSVCLNAIILSLLYTKSPEECQLVLVDPKRVEMSLYKDIPHLRCPIVTGTEDVVEVFESLVAEMEDRYTILSESQTRNIESYNSSHEQKMPYIVTVIDEMADLMMTSGRELEGMIVRLAQLARAVGIHLVMATQKPIVKVITGLIKSNMPSRISFQVASKSDSRVILDSNGAESLIGKGDMLMLYPGASEPERFHGAWISDKEILDVTNFIRGNV